MCVVHPFNLISSLMSFESDYITSIDDHAMSFESDYITSIDDHAMSTPSWQFLRSAFYVCIHSGVRIATIASVACQSQVAACDASAPSWQFLRSAWAQLQAQGRAAAGQGSILDVGTSPCTHAHTNIYTLTYMHTHTCTHICTNACIHMHIHIYTRTQTNTHTGEEGAQLLWVISHAASRFPAEDAAALAQELLQVCMCVSRE